MVASGRRRDSRGSPPRPRVGQHFTLKIGSRKMTSVSCSCPARIRVLQAGLRNHRSGVSGHRVQV